MTAAAITILDIHGFGLLKFHKATAWGTRDGLELSALVLSFDPLYLAGIQCGFIIVYLRSGGAGSHA